MSGNIQHFTIYKHPKDYPGKFVVRRWTIDPRLPEPIPDQQPVAVAATLEKARESVPQGLYRMPHQEGESSVIVETWI